MPKYIDAHCHILSDENLKPATACGVGRFIVNATAPSDWNKIVETANHDNCIIGAIGVHPWYIDDLSDDWDIRLGEILSTKPNLMVGEIGLDKKHADMEKQIAVFKRQLEIAHDLGRVVHIHCVGAWGKMMDVLRETQLPPVMLFHCFSGTPEMVSELVKMNAYFSFGAGICDEKHKTMRDAVVAVPENRILAESDAQGVLIPDTVPNVVLEIAKLRGVAPEQMAETIYKNTLEMLNEQSV